MFPICETRTCVLITKRWQPNRAEPFLTATKPLTPRALRALITAAVHLDRYLEYIFFPKADFLVET
mgnify:FL=1